MTAYEFHANGLSFGVYSGQDLSRAQEVFARDAGYASWAYMCELAEEYGGNSVEASEVLRNGQVAS